jgi:hypothetical protein
MLSEPSLAVALYRLMRRNQVIGPVLGQVARAVAGAWEEQLLA